MKNFNNILIFCVLLSSCAADNAKNINGSYFDLKGTIAHQITILKQKQPLILKKTRLDEQLDSLTRPVANWEKELGIFAEADINKPVFLDRYQVSTIHNTDNQEITTYLAASPDFKVRSMEVSKKANKLISVQVVFEENNYLYDTSRTMKLFFDNDTLSAYQVEGYHRLLLQEKVTYSTEAVVRR